MRLSVVIPCYNEDAVLKTSVPRFLALADLVPDMDLELVFVDDGSKDRTLPMLRRFAEAHPEIRVLSFARNFGHQIAVTAGVDAATGDAVVLIDADLQDPPEVVPEMVAKWREGYDVVYGTRRERAGETWFKTFSARMFYRLINNLSSVPIPLDTGDFRLMGRNVVEALKTMPERHRFVRGMVAWVGFRQLALPYDREERFAGESKYPLRKMLKFAMDGILSFSSKPLRIAMNLGLLSAGLSLGAIVYAVGLRILTSNWVEGWTALMIATLFLGGVQLVSIGILGEYVGRIYEEAKKRPLYVLQERIGYSQSSEDG